MGARSGSWKQPSLAPAGNQGSGAAIAPTIRECVAGRDPAERALRRMQLEVAVGFVGAMHEPAPETCCPIDCGDVVTA